MSSVLLSHVALSCRSEENSDRFYKDLLGLKKMRTFVLAADLAKSLFGLDGECTVVDYKNDDAHFEIFLVGDTVPIGGFNHVCISVDNREDLIKMCTEGGFEFTKLPKGRDDIFLFIKDLDGNIFEVKENVVVGEII